MRSEQRGFVPCNHEYLNFKGGKFSKSRGAAVDVPYFLSKYDPDPLRFYLTATFPETRDTEACPACPEPGRGKGTEGSPWEDFVERNNPVLSAAEGNELVATWGNLGQRPRRALGFMLSFAYGRFDGKVPEPGALDDEDQALLEKVEAGFETVGDLYNACKFRAALGECLGYEGQLFGTQHVVEYEEETRSHRTRRGRKAAHLAQWQCPP